ARATVRGLILAELEAALDVDAHALRGALGYGLGLTTERGHTEPLGVIGPFAVALTTTGGRRHPEAGDGSTVLGVALLGIAAQISDKDDLAQARHSCVSPVRLFLAGGCRGRGREAFGAPQQVADDALGEL